MLKRSAKYANLFEGPFDPVQREELAARVDELVEQRDEVSGWLLENGAGTDKPAEGEEYSQRAYRCTRLDIAIKDAKEDLEAYDRLNPEVAEATAKSFNTAREGQYEAMRAYLDPKQNPLDVIQSDEFKDFRSDLDPTTFRGAAADACMEIKMPSLQDRMDALLAANQNSRLVVLPGGGRVATADGLHSDNATGQEAVQERIVPGVVEALAYFGAIARSCPTIFTATGGDWIMPQADSKDQKGEILTAQGVDVSKLQAPTIGKIVFKMETLSSKYITVSREMLQDAVFDVMGWLFRMVVRRIGRLHNEAATVGVANTDYEGLVPKCLEGVTTTGANALTLDNLIDLIYSIDRAYREGDEGGEGGFMDQVNTGMGRAVGRTGFMFHDDVEKLLFKMKDSDGRPLWLPSIQSGTQNRVLGYGYDVNNDLGAMGTTGNVPALFGNFNHYIQRNASTLQIFRFYDSQTAAANEVWVMAFARRTARHAGPMDNDDNQAIAKATLG